MRTILDDIKEYETMDERLLIEEQPSQTLLRYKMTISSILNKRDPQKYYYLRADSDKFAMSELMVNQLMKFAFERGFEAGKRLGSNEGYDNAMQEVKNRLGF